MADSFCTQQADTTEIRAAAGIRNAQHFFSTGWYPVTCEQAIRRNLSPTQCYSEGASKVVEDWDESLNGLLLTKHQQTKFGPEWAYSRRKLNGRSNVFMVSARTLPTVFYITPTAEKPWVHVERELLQIWTRVNLNLKDSMPVV